MTASSGFRRIHRFVQTAGEIETIVATTAAGASDSAKCERLKDKGVSIIETEDVDGQVDLRQLMTILGGKGIDGILLEGGGELNYSMVSENLVDEACVFIAPKIFGGEGKYSPVSGTGVMCLRMHICLDLTRSEDLMKM